ncbi:hypothetical protein IF1G_04801 [Cordyceps javanica]|uniref:Uncharacterized protein n=1 Tax=Cordyceps javanica TaxID=43265 RepID=A0A545V3C6_9HYPO|nr:hypothetical protein IF1G_04801 [Cordyceps javanica]
MRRSTTRLTVCHILRQPNIIFKTGHDPTLPFHHALVTTRQATDKGLSTRAIRTVSPCPALPCKSIKQRLAPEQIGQNHVFGAPGRFASLSLSLGPNFHSIAELRAGEGGRGHKSETARQTTPDNCDRHAGQIDYLRPSWSACLPCSIRPWTGRSVGIGCDVRALRTLPTPDH